MIKSETLLSIRIGKFVFIFWSVNFSKTFEIEYREGESLCGDLFVLKIRIICVFSLWRIEIMEPRMIVVGICRNIITLCPSCLRCILEM